MRKQFEKVIISKSNKPNKNGYVLNTLDNLIEGIGFKLFEKDLIDGSGNELVSKFNALYSSAALAVNNFAIIKKHIDEFKFLEYSNFYEGKFERKFPTGLGGTAPHLDFAIENNNTVIAFESKYLELLDKTRVAFPDSYNKIKLNYLDDFLFTLIERYRGQYLFLDVAQLIKHSIGLIKHKIDTGKDALLVYIYWIPDNYNSFQVYTDHFKELDQFTKEINNYKDLKFLAMTYVQFWDTYGNSNIFRSHFDKVKKRYKIEI